MWHFLSTLLAILTALSIADVYGQRCLFNLLVWIKELIIAGFWWCLDVCWWILTHVLLPFFVVTAIISSAYLLRIKWKKLMDQWDYEKAHTSRIKRVGE